MILQNIALFVLILPLISSISIHLFKSNNIMIATFTSSLLMLITSLLAIILFKYNYDNMEKIEFVFGSWFSSAKINMNLSIVIDRLTSIMAVMITLVSLSVHFYALSYLEKEHNIIKNFSLLSLLTFFMLLLVFANNFVQLFLGWQGIGLCSYLLIGRFGYGHTANSVAIKTFIINAIADFSLLFGIIILWYYTGQIEFSKISMQALSLTVIPSKLGIYWFNILDLICLLLFIACMIKSAQIGVHTWLIDSVLAPIPASALIHSVTMVATGVFLVVRCSFLFEHSEIILHFITIVGGITCIYAAIAALLQTDIKKIIAYSTCSQLGYIFLACGNSAYRTAMFHLITHAFSKAMLFLSVANIIYRTNEQNINNFGGLNKKLPITYLNFLLAGLSLIGIYPLAGFYSKDLVLETIYSSSYLGKPMFVVGIIAVFFTAMYIIKMILFIFHNNSKLSTQNFEKIVELPPLMNASLVILTTGIFFFGMIGFYILKINSYSGYFIDNIFELSIKSKITIPLIIKFLPMFFAVLGIAFAIKLYKKN